MSAIVLAGGRSSRFGRDKLAEPIRGRPMLEHAIDAIRPFAREILVVAAPDGTPTVPGDVIVVRDASPFGGPLLGLQAGLDRATESAVLVTAGDMLELQPAVIELLVASLDDARVDAAVLAEGDRPRPLPMVIRRDVARVTSARLIEAGERRLGALTDALACRVFSEPDWRPIDPEGRSLRDIDTTADLR